MGESTRLPAHPQPPQDADSAPQGDEPISLREVHGLILPLERSPEAAERKLRDLILHEPENVAAEYSFPSFFEPEDVTTERFHEDFWTWAEIAFAASAAIREEMRTHGRYLPPVGAFKIVLRLSAVLRHWPALESTNDEPEVKPTDKAEAKVDEQEQQEKAETSAPPVVPPPEEPERRKRSGPFTPEQITDLVTFLEDRKAKNPRAATWGNQNAIARLAVNTFFKGVHVPQAGSEAPRLVSFKTHSRTILRRLNRCGALERLMEQGAKA